METMALGMFAVILLILSGCCLYCKKPFFGLVSGTAAMALICWTGHSWKLMLMDSGKDTALLGFNRYPAALVILCILSVLAVGSMAVSVILMARKGKRIK